MVEDLSVRLAWTSQIKGRSIMTSHTHDHGHHRGHGETPTQVLMAEHELILEALDALEQRVAAIREGTPPDRAYMEKAVTFLREFADTCHHGKEENLLFTRMAERGFPTRSGPIAVMLSEHEAGRAYIRGIADGAATLATDPAAADRIAQNARGYIDLLRAHIGKENTVLFPMADRALTPEDQAHLAKEFERFEAEKTGAGVHEAMLKLLAELKAGT
jgi:hemerythrin-like domain-containing protein